MDVRLLFEQAGLRRVDSRIDRAEPGLSRAAARVHRSASMVSRRLRVAALPALLLLVVSACRGPQQSYTALGTKALPLKQQFNQDAGHTRIVLLPAPT